MNIAPARVAAYEILLRIGRERAFSSSLLPFYEADLDDRDRGLCHELVLGTLRRQIYLDRLIESLTRGKKLDDEVSIALRLGLYQMLFLEKVPAYSAINESVELVKRARKVSAKGLVNAVLRKVSKELPSLSFTDSLEQISVETSHPKWLIAKWSEAFGSETARLIAESNNNIPDPVFRFTNNATEKTAGELGNMRKGKYASGAYIADRISPKLLELAKTHFIYFQDEGSQMVGEMVSRMPGGSVLDVCAAPGSKTTQIAISRSSGQRMTAGDLHRQRVEFLRSNCLDQGTDNVDILQYDAEAALPFADETFDTVLVDAPCSGTGTIRHNPEIRYFLEPADFAELSPKQLKILTNASKLLKIGGSIIYSTCSLEPEENEGVCSAFLAENDQFEILTPDLPSELLTPDGYARTFPHRDNLDGFFIAVFRRISG